MAEQEMTTPAAAGNAASWHDAEELRWAARHWAARIGVKLTRVQLRPMQTKWGSISTAGRLTLNTELVAMPKPLGEFVIVHELVHLLAPNHGRVFKSFMRAYMPDWQQRDRELRQSTKRAGKALK
jgi:predicted metal-dependent hydrolase